MSIDATTIPKCMLIAYLGKSEFHNEESRLTFVPRIGDHIEMDDPRCDDGGVMLCKVVAVAYANDDQKDTHIDVYVEPGPLFLSPFTTAEDVEVTIRPTRARRGTGEHDPFKAVVMRPAEDSDSDAVISEMELFPPEETP